MGWELVNIISPYFSPWRELQGVWYWFQATTLYVRALWIIRLFREVITGYANYR